MTGDQDSREVTEKELVDWLWKETNYPYGIARNLLRDFDIKKKKESKRKPHKWACFAFRPASDRDKTCGVCGHTRRKHLDRWRN